MNPYYPVYVISKGRWKSRLTVRALQSMGVPFRLVIEPTEFDEYAKHIEESAILCLPFHDLGQGSIPARNWVWEHAISEGHARHWILDDNIEAFNRLNRNAKPVVLTGATFKAIEDFVNRYENIGLSGMNYYSFCKTTEKVPPYYLNTRIYSCILIDNTLPFRWRGRYNEDTDLSLRVLKEGLCTVLFNAFLAGKVCTMRMKGGNTDDLYQGEGRLKMAESLVEQHPDVAKIAWKFGRWQHSVDYSVFRRNKLIRKSSYSFTKENNEYGMVLIDREKLKRSQKSMMFEGQK